MDRDTRSTSGATAGLPAADTAATQDPLELLIEAVRRDRRSGEPLEHAMRRVWVRERDRLDWATIVAFRTVGEAALGPDAALEACPTVRGGYLAFIGFLMVAGRRIGPAD
ncbi:MAG: hypothetical protein ACP5VP_06415 [Candidatus Limnocylindrales bacterium]